MTRQIFAVLLLLYGAILPAHAAEVKVLSAGAVEPGVPLNSVKNQIHRVSITARARGG